MEEYIAGLITLAIALFIAWLTFPIWNKEKRNKK